MHACNQAGIPEKEAICTAPKPWAKNVYDESNRCHHSLEFNDMFFVVPTAVVFLAANGYANAFDGTVYEVNAVLQG